MTHGDFIVGYQNGRLGCGVNVLRVSLLVYSNKIREKRIVIKVIGWSVGLLALTCLWIVGLFFLHPLWTLLAGAIVLPAFAMVSLHQVAGVVLAAALADNAFYRLVVAEHALGVASDAESNLPQINKVVPMRDPRQARRR